MIPVEQVAVLAWNFVYIYNKCLAVTYRTMLIPHLVLRYSSYTHSGMTKLKNSISICQSYTMQLSLLSDHFTCFSRYAPVDQTRVGTQVIRHDCLTYPKASKRCFAVAEFRSSYSDGTSNLKQAASRSNVGQGISIITVHSLSEELEWWSIICTP